MLIASPLVAMVGLPSVARCYHLAHVHRRDRRRRHLHRSDAVDERTGRVVVTKVPSEPRNESAARAGGLAGAGHRRPRRAAARHGTTVGTNAVLERRGRARGDPDDRGLRDLIEIGRTKRNIPALFVPTFVRPSRSSSASIASRSPSAWRPTAACWTELDPDSVERALDAAAARGRGDRRLPACTRT
jgi:N-methylhydantoinase A/oxoprolinase/acetone carboxylase beta subunit